MKTITDKTDEPVLALWERWIGLFVVVAMLLVLAFFAFHQVADTGFFTARFGRLEMVALYGPIIVSLAAPVVRAWTGRRNPARLFEIATNLSLALGSLWLVTVFPFDFRHLADVMPGSTRLFFSWMTNDMGRAVLVLQVILSPITALLTALQYLVVRQQEPALGEWDSRRPTANSASAD